MATHKFPRCHLKGKAQRYFFYYQMHFLIKCLVVAVDLGFFHTYWVLELKKLPYKFQIAAAMLSGLVFKKTVCSWLSWSSTQGSTREQPNTHAHTQAYILALSSSHAHAHAHAHCHAHAHAHACILASSCSCLHVHIITLLSSLSSPGVLAGAPWSPAKTDIFNPQLITVMELKEEKG